MGIEERRNDTNYVYEEFQKQLECGPGGFNETNLIWRDNHSPLKNRKFNSLGRLSSLVKNLTHWNQLDRYDNIIQDQIIESIVQKVDEICEREITVGEKVFYFP